MNEQQPVSKNVNIIKKVVLGLLIAVGVLIVLLIIVTVASRFSQNKLAQTTYYTGDMGYGVVSDEIGLAPSVPTFREKYSAATTETNLAAMPPIADTIEQKVIKTANLSITVDDVDKAAAQITNEAVLVDGFIQNSSITENERGQRFANLILRVPVSSFETVVGKIKSLAKLVEREDIGGREVTEEYVDLQADLTHNLAVEQQYLELLKRAQKVEEIIAVRDKLDQVQAEIERIKGRLRYMDNQTEMATIAVSISSEAKVTLPAEKWQPWVVVKESAKKLIVTMQNFVSFIIVLIFSLIALIPYIILFLVIYLLVKWLYKKYKKPKQNM